MGGKVMTGRWQAAARSKKKSVASRDQQANRGKKARGARRACIPQSALPRRRGSPVAVRNCCHWARRVVAAAARAGAWRGGGMMEAGGAGGRDERVPQWGAQETRELIARHAGRWSREAVAARRSTKTMWEAVAARLRERGYRRTADQCKCKWKNLVNRYKGKETSDPDNGRQCPFFEELHAVFTERARNMQRQLLESESGASVKKKTEATKRNSALICNGEEMTERRAQERLVLEQEWRQSMQTLEQERLMLEHSWIEREEQRRLREEARAEKRDALLRTLLNKLLQEDL
ncbi:hypothetical protein PR202_ga19148 [Eleusine coracana subsp. coracana]|uniref:Myb-like domain-containing protein n=1 Tax=Eleusine coracana subsp. coracana TaxID=191504 RepID=A0AAV5CTR8_ELECO|nr:hypothetical protein PR202_ga19148 [Eleusine coracana subsp. coracana]